MKRFIVAVALAILLLTCFCSCMGKAYTSVNCDEFKKQGHVTQDIEARLWYELEIRLCSVPTEEFGWSETALIDNPEILHQIGHKMAVLKNPYALLPLSEAIELYIFKTHKKGKATIKMEHHDPSGNESQDWTYELNVTVR